jgi:hypothetical protein
MPFSLSLAASIEPHKAYVGHAALQSLAWRSSQFHIQPRNTNCASTYYDSLAGPMTKVTDIGIVILVLTCYVHYIVALLRVQCTIHLGHGGEPPFALQHDVWPMANKALCTTSNSLTVSDPMY